MPAEDRYAVDQPHVRGALEGLPDEPIRAGTMLWVFTDPHRGHEVAYNRWYERDHYYGGCMIGPWHFAGSRWVATSAHKRARPEPDASMGLGRGEGSYACLYWYLDGHHQDAMDWATPQVHALYADDRGFGPRSHHNTGTYSHRWRSYRDEHPVPVELALDHRYGGLVVWFVDPVGSTEAVDGFFAERLPTFLDGSPIASFVAWDLVPLSDEKPDFVPDAPSDRRLLVAQFVEGDPLDSWSEQSALIDELTTSGVGTVPFASAFVPTVIGTDRHVDDLWID